MLVATEIKADWNHAADSPVVGPVWVGMVLVEMNLPPFLVWSLPIQMSHIWQ